MKLFNQTISHNTVSVKTVKEAVNKPAVSDIDQFKTSKNTLQPIKK